MSQSDAYIHGFVGNNPVNWVDPYGLWRLPDFVSESVSITIPTPYTGTILSWTFSASADRERKYGYYMVGDYI